MNAPQQKLNMPEQPPALPQQQPQPPKSPYEAPRLWRLGDVKQVTAGAPVIPGPDTLGASA